MPTFEFTSPDGKKYEIEGPEGATQEQAFQILSQQLNLPQQTTQQPVQPPTPQPSLGQRIVSGAEERLGNIAQTARQQFGPGSGPLNLNTPTPFATTALSAMGNLAAIPLGAVGEVISEITPDVVKRKLSEVAQSKPVQAVAQGVQSLNQKYPVQMQEMGNIANVALLATPKVAPPRTAGSRLISSSKKEIARNKRQFVDELLVDKGKDIDKAFFKDGKVQFRMIRRDKVTAAQVSKLKDVSRKKNIIQNRTAIQEANSKVISELDTALQRSPARINAQGAENLVDRTVSNAVQKELFLDEPTTISIRRIGEAMKQAIRENANTPAGLWAARKQFDQAIEKIRPNVFSDAAKPYNYVAGEVRRTINDIISSAVPEARIKGMLSESHYYFNALAKTEKEAIKFARAEAPNTIEKAVLHAINIASRRGSISQGTKIGTGVALTAATALAGYPTLAALVGTGTAVLTTGSLVSRLARSPYTRRALGEALSLVERSIGAAPNRASYVSRLRADRAALLEMLQNYPEEQNGN